MRKYLWIPASLFVLAFSALAVSQAFGAAGSGQSADTRNDEFVVICHYDRNQQGPNAGPHTITINVNALDHHLENHVKAEGFEGDDSVGPCPGSTPGVTQTAPARTQTAQPTPD
jgi:hypothetical protein